MGSTETRRSETMCKKHFLTRYLGLAALLTTSLFYIPSLAPLLCKAAPVNFFIPFELIGYATMAIAGLASFMLARQSILENRFGYRVGVGLHAIAAGLFSYMVLTGHSPFFLVAVTAVLAAVGGLFVWVAWGMCYAALSLEEAIFYVALCSALASLLGVWLYAVPLALAMGVFVLLAIIACVVPMYAGRHGEEETASSCMPTYSLEMGMQLSAQGEASSVGKAFVGNGNGASFFRGSIASMGSVIKLPALGLIVLACTDSLSGLASLYSTNHATQVAGFVMAALCFIPLLMSSRFTPTLPFVYQVVLPLFVLLMFTMRILAGEGLVPNAAFDVGLYLLYGFVVVLALSHVTAAIRAQEFPAWCIVSFVYGAYGVAGLLGAVGNVTMVQVGSNPGSITLVIWVVYFVFLALLPGIQRWIRESKENEEWAQEVGASVSSKWDQVSSAYGLSPRELEILRYLGRGYSSKYIADALVISDNTVRTHTRHIYRKMGVSSRDELVDRMEKESKYTENQG